MDNKEIKIGIGVDKIKFGMSPEEVAAVLGEADEKNKITYSDEDPDYYSEEWHYDTMEMSLVFDMMDKLELTTISISSEDFTLGNVSIIANDESDVFSILRKAGLEEGWEELEEEEASQKTFVNEEEGISLYFEDGLLSEFQWEML